MISTRHTSLDTPHPLNRPPRLGASLGLVLAGFAIGMSLGGCAATTTAVKDAKLLSLSKPYRIDILQGNVVTSEQAALLKPGFSRTQVRELLGSPMLADPFHANRWDYVFVFQRPGQPALSRSLIATFDGETLSDVQIPDGDLPSETEFVSTLAPAPAKAKPAPQLELTDAQREALARARPTSDRAAPAAAAAVSTATPGKSYPPLEP